MHPKRIAEPPPTHLRAHSDEETAPVNALLRPPSLSFRTSRALFLPPSFGVFGGSDRERFEVASEGM